MINVKRDPASASASRRRRDRRLFATAGHHASQRDERSYSDRARIASPVVEFIAPPPVVTCAAIGLVIDFEAPVIEHRAVLLSVPHTQHQHLWSTLQRYHEHRATRANFSLKNRSG